MRRSILAATGVGVLLLGSAARADTLREALVEAYHTNPTLTSARAGQRATDEGVPLARASGLPTLNATTDYQEFVQRSANSFTAPLRAASAGGSLGVPIFQGGGVKNAVRAADARVDAGRAGLRATEADVFTAAVSAYMDVIRDRSIVVLNESNVRVLEQNFMASRDRFEVGDLTRTDVAQSEARLALARSQLQSARAQVESSEENYTRIVGSPPGDLQPPPSLPPSPATAAAAVDIAVSNNPTLLAAKEQSEAARYDIGVAKATRLPRVSVVANSNYTNFLGTLGGNLPGRTFAQTQQTATVGLSGTIPLFQGGAPAARVRRAQALSSQALEQVVLAERNVVANVRAAFSRRHATLGVIESSEIAVSANLLALEGVRAENSVGTRNILDVLNAEQELLNSSVQLVTARRDAYVAGFALLAAMGRAEARDLGLDGGALYDPVVNYRRVRNRIWDWDSDPEPQPVATRTVMGPPANTPVTPPSE